VSLWGIHKPSPDPTMRRPQSRFHSDEPSFNGKTLRDWLRQEGPQVQSRVRMPGFVVGVRPDFQRTEQEAAKIAIRSMGRDAVPLLLEILRNGSAEAREAVKGFAALREIARPATAELLQLLDESDETIHQCAILALGYVDDSPVTVRALMDELRANSLSAIESLGNMGQAAASAAPMLVARLKKSEPGWDIPLIIALGKIRSKVAIPVLVEIIEREAAKLDNRGRDIGSLDRRQYAIDALGRIGAEARETVPFLTELLKRENTSNIMDLYFKRGLIAALGSIGPEAREAIPILTEISRNERFSNYRLAEPAAAALAKINISP
jgi:HEAT repeat protein